jgi:hypothetical protein
MGKKKSVPVFPLDEFERVENIIFLDEPVLTHLKRKNTDYFLYLVDTKIEEQLDVYLLFQVSEENIYNYLTSQLSLKNLILGNTNFIYLLEQDFNGIVNSYSVVTPLSLSSEYLPLDDSFLSYEPTEESHYHTLLNSTSYVKKLRQDAFYVKFSSENSKYAETIGLNELSNDLLQNLSKSFKGFLKADFRHSLENYQTDNKKLRFIYNKLEGDLDLRMVYLKCASFEIGLANDKIMKTSIKDKRIRTWAEEVGLKFKDVVLSNDFSENRLNKIIDTYTEEERNKIFRPLFDITENQNFSIAVKDSLEDSYRRISIRDKGVIDKIIPKKIENEVVDEDYEIIQVTSVVNKNKRNKTIPLEGNLFSSSDITQYHLKIEDFSKYGYPIREDIDISLDIMVQKKHLVISTNYEGEHFQVIEPTMKINEGIKKVTAKISEFYLSVE